MHWRAEFFHWAYHKANQAHAPWCPKLNVERPGNCVCDDEED